MAQINFANVEAIFLPGDYFYVQPDGVGKVQISLVTKGRRKPLKIRNISQVDFDKLCSQMKNSLLRNREEKLETIIQPVETFEKWTEKLLS